MNAHTVDPRPVAALSDSELHTVIETILCDETAAGIDLGITASLDFEPWDRAGERITMSDLFRMAAEGRFHGAHVAQELMFDTKEEMIARMSSLSDDVLVDLWESTHATSNWFLGLAKMTEAAASRIAVAVACIAIERGETSA